MNYYFHLLDLLLSESVCAFFLILNDIIQQCTQTLSKCNIFCEVNMVVEYVEFHEAVV